MTLFDTCIAIAAAIFVPICTFFAINDTLDEKPCIFINKLIHKRNTNLYIYKLLNEWNTESAFERFTKAFTGERCFYSELLTSPLKEKEKNIILNAYRFVLGLINTNTFNENKETEIFSYVFRDITIPKDEITEEKMFEKENFIIGNYKLLDAVFDGTRKCCYSYCFINTATNEKISVTADFNEYLNDCDEIKDKVIREKLSFLFE